MELPPIREHPEEPGDRRVPAEVPHSAWHALDAAEAARRLDADGGGLSSEEAAERLARYGDNALPAAPERTLIDVIVAQFANPLIYLLLVAGSVALVLNELADAVFIFVVLVINAAVGTVQEWRAQANLSALRSAIQVASRVRRDGRVRRMDAAALVPGDVVLIDAGDRVPADIRLLSSADLSADEASLTGESMPVAKTAEARLDEATLLAERRTMLFAGSTVQRGRAEGLVVATGGATELGRIAKALHGPAVVPPLTRRLQRFSNVIGAIAIAIVAGLILQQLSVGAPLRDTFFIAIALAVSIIPEGVPVAVTVALSIATARMARRNVIVRHLPAVEGLGACTVVATDKTGTLTVNRLTASRLWLPRLGTVEVGGGGYDVSSVFHWKGAPLPSHDAKEVVALARAGATVNDAERDPDDGVDGGSGDTLDLALLVLAEKAGLEIGALRAAAPRRAEIPFSAERRFAATVNSGEDGCRLQVKGAPEVIVPLCGDAGQGEAYRAAEDLAAAGYRVIAIAGRSLDAAPGEPGWRGMEAELRGLTLVGLVGFIDPLRPEAAQAVAHCLRAGVKVKMITGDHAATALSIARELGIARDRDDVVTGHDILRLADRPDELKALLAGASVFARVEPSQKVDIVNALKAAGEIVAMTGDGVNDAPALRRADLGVAMGRGGTDVARDAADLVLTDDNFASIVAGIEEGRAAYANIRKVVYLMISTGAAEVVMFMAAIFTGLPVPLTAVQLLWLNVVTNGGQDVALAFERREPGLLNRPPRPPREPIFDRLMIGESAVSGIYMGLVSYGVFAWALSMGWSEFEARNVLLFLMVAFENAHVFNCRSETRSTFRIPFSHNWPVVLAAIGAQMVHISAAFIPGLSDVLDVAPIAVDTWLMLVPAALSLILVMEIAKAVWRRTAMAPAS